MKRIYYLEKHEVKLGDIIEYNGIKTLITEELIELNPELFKVEEHIQPIYFKALKGIKPFTTGRVYKQVDSIGSPITIKLIADDNEEWTIHNWQSVSINESSSCSCFELSTKEEWDKQELLDKAKRDFPVGTVFRGFFGTMCTVGDKSSYSLGAGSSILIDNIYVHRDGRWAKVLPLKFITEDGVKIYGDMKTYLVHPNDSIDICISHSSWYGDSGCKDYKYFYHKENALAYIEKHKEKTLDDYEDMFLRIDIDSINAREVCWFYRTLKGKEPKLYYTKILQLIADDLNDGRYIHIRGNTSYHLSNAREVNVHCGGDEGCVYFKSRELAEKARGILGDKINNLFN